MNGACATGLLRMAKLTVLDQNGWSVCVSEGSMTKVFVTLYWMRKEENYFAIEYIPKNL